MTETKELAGRQAKLASFARSLMLHYDGAARGNLSDIAELADALERLSPPEGLTLETTAEDLRLIRAFARLTDVSGSHIHARIRRLLADHDTLTALLATKEAALVEANARAEAEEVEHARWLGQALAERDEARAVVTTLTAANERMAAALEKIDAGVKALRAAASRGPLTSREIFAMTDPIADKIARAALNDQPAGESTP